MASPPETDGFSDVRKVGYLRKPKSMHKRFFVLRAASEAGGPARLEYYENEKKWRHKSSAPKRSIPLESCFNINKRADSKNKHLVALYTRDEHFAIAADSEAEQDSWYQALLQLHNRAKGHHDGAAAPGAGGVGGGSCSGSSGLGEAGEDLSYGDVAPGPAFKEVWQVILKPKGLGQTKNLIGIYRLCLTSKTISFVKLNSEAAAVVLQLMNIRRCGHSENFFFIEVGRSAVTGPGEFWMQVDDSVVAQSMHETILEAMRAMSDEFRPRSKSQSSSNCSNPISVPLRRHHLNNPPPSQVGLTRRSRTESITATSPASLVGGKQGSFRVRASSDGEGTMSRPASVDGSPVSPSTNRTHAHRHRGSSRLHPPLNHSRSIPMPSSRCSPSATSPVSLSSSSTSGHGSTSDCLFPRRSSASVSGSPSDGGFISSDEYGSSPCDFRSSFRSVTPDSLGHTPPARGEEELSNYICMGGKGPSTLAAPNGHYILPRGSNGHRYVPGGAALGLSPALAAEDSATGDVDNRFRKRTHSAGTSPTISHQKTPSQSSVASIEEYTEMMPAYPPGGGSGARLPSYRHSAFVPTHSYPEEPLEMHPLERRGGHPRPDSAGLHTDDGYMPMSPGVAPSPSGRKGGGSGGGGGGGGDYMPMSPKSVSAPQQIINPIRRHPQRVDPNGYMMMSPSGSCSPDISGGPGGGGGGGGSATPSGGSYGKLWTNGVGGHPSPTLPHPKLLVESSGAGGKLLSCAGDYMNMSPVGDSATSSPSDCYYVPEDPQHKPVLSYCSLPRSFKHTPRPGELEEPVRHQHLRLSSSSGRLVYAATAAEDSSSSTSSDSLGGGYCAARPEPGLPPLHHQVLQPHLPRKVDTAAQTHSRLTRPTRLSLGDPKASTLPRAREQPPLPPQPPLLHPPEPKSPGEYVNIEFGGDQPGYLSGPVASHSPPAARCPALLQPAPREEETGAEGYMNMDLGPRRAGWQDSAGPAPLGASGLCRPTRAVPGSRGDYMTMQMACPRPSYVDTSPVAPISYADMRTGVVVEEASLPGATADAPSSSSAASTSPAAPPGAGELAGCASLLGAPQGPGAMSAFTRVNLSPNRNQSAKVIRADPQGCRRRHSSETFSSTPSATRAGNTVPFGGAPAVGGGASGGNSTSPQEVKRHSSASFENVWLRPGELGGAPKEPAQVCGAAGGLENGLNYIDLDLVKDFKQRPPERPPQPQPPPAPGPHPSLGSSESSRRSSEDLSAYTSISFQKRLEDRQ
ncbi:insulin receptor substrate 1 [Sorex araneus]|uniref:insulin receptor substrate 1 n=1 Tax=Sorex araneus TaxID=42254 RepID=UPI00243408BB|nr:insulin receptor substrate 1 [Sorex araneus]